jgi:hypothetical protein
MVSTFDMRRGEREPKNGDHWREYNGGSVAISKRLASIAALGIKRSSIILMDGCDIPELLSEKFEQISGKNKFIKRVKPSFPFHQHEVTSYESNREQLMR